MTLLQRSFFMEHSVNSEVHGIVFPLGYLLPSQYLAACKLTMMLNSQSMTKTLLSFSFTQYCGDYRSLFIMYSKVRMSMYMSYTCHAHTRTHTHACTLTYTHTQSSTPSLTLASVHTYTDTDTKPKFMDSYVHTHTCRYVALYCSTSH